MNQPSPAIVSQDSVRRLPRWGLLLFCVVYALAGFVGREPWRRDDITSFGYMLDIANGHSAWLSPGLLGEPLHSNVLLPYWLGAAAIKLCPSWMMPAQAVQLAFAMLLLLTLLAAWYTVYYLARSRQAQPVSFAFGGEAQPADYARAVADGGVLALLACLGLAQLAHETSPVAVQLCCATLLLCGLAALPYHAKRAILVAGAGMVGLCLSGAPATAMFMGLLGLLVYGLSPLSEWFVSYSEYEQTATEWQRLRRSRLYSLAGIAVLILFCALLATVLHLWRWRIDLMPARWVPWRNLIRTHLWFCWPVWPFTLWTLWQWRRQWHRALPSRHIALPLGIVAISGLNSILTGKGDTLLLALPAYAALAAFALPTFRRSVGALVDWLSLISFSLAGLYVWFVWAAAVTGFPSKQAARVYRMSGGYIPHFEWITFLAALAVTLLWFWLVRWRTSRLRPAIWKSMILPAGGVVMCWVLLTTLWLPSLNYVRSYAPVVAKIVDVLAPHGRTPSCVQEYALEDAQITALLYYGRLPLTNNRSTHCSWLLVQEKSIPILPQVLDMTQWHKQGAVQRPGDKRDTIVVFSRVKTPQ